MNGNVHSSIIDALSTNVVDGDLVKVVSWYDNEWAPLAAGRHHGDRDRQGW